VSFSDPGMVTFFRDNMNQMIDGGVDLVFCNEIEALGWAETESLDEATSKLKGIAKSFVITRGGDGAILFDGETTHEIAAQKVEAVNTNGAGDMFAGAFFYSLWRGGDMRGACEFASKAAAAVVCQPGPRLSLSDSQELKNSHFEA
jgi:sugar/nucleoside kinase (ribokinase family)